jgi:hypothetical protein
MQNINVFQVDPSYSTGSSRKELHDLIDLKSEELLKGDVLLEYRRAVEWGRRNNLIRNLTQGEIDQYNSNKPWLEVNKVIRQNEEQP